MSSDDKTKALEYYKNQFCEGFCLDLPECDTYDKSMDFYCAGCRARSVLGKQEKKRVDKYV